MGYSEVYCHICGVSFNISRIRRAGEPRNAAFDGGRRDGKINFLEEELGDSADCNEDTGCGFVIRGMERPNDRVKNDLGLQQMLDDEKETEYRYESSAEDGSEILEFQSDEEMEDEPLGASCEDAMTDNDAEATDEVLEIDQDKAWIRQFWIETFSRKEPAKQKENYRTANPDIQPWYRNSPTLQAHLDTTMHDEVFPKTNLDSAAGNEVGSDTQLVEHIAGPRCKNDKGYNGNLISAEEMFGCNTLQCLVRKTKETSPWHDDEAFEREGAFFLSGLSDCMPSRDMDTPSVFPQRHWCSKIEAENILWDERRVGESAMPFHPSCFEVFKRASLLSTGKIDIDGLTSWWSMEADYAAFHSEFPRHEDVRSCSEQWWEHANGTEYLAANPLYVPGLTSIFESAISQDPGFNIHDGAFTRNGPREGSTDLFSILPHEIRMLICSFMSSKDIANLRLTFRSFHQLPISLWYSLMLSEMPWLWEARTELHYGKWATVTCEMAKAIIQRHETEQDSHERYIEIVKEELPEIGQEIRERLPERRKYSCIQTAKPAFLPMWQTNWYKLYCDITRNWKDLRGLQNRERIWNDCEEILRRIRRYRDAGYIPEHGSISVDDIKAMLRENRHPPNLE